MTNTNKRAVFLKEGDLCPNINCGLPVFEALVDGEKCRCSTAGITFIPWRIRRIGVCNGKITIIEQ